MGSAVGAHGENVSPGGHRASWGERGRLGPDFEPDFEPEFAAEFEPELGLDSTRTWQKLDVKCCSPRARFAQ